MKNCMRYLERKNRLNAIYKNKETLPGANGNGFSQSRRLYCAIGTDTERFDGIRLVGKAEPKKGGIIILPMGTRIENFINNWPEGWQVGKYMHMTYLAQNGTVFSKDSVSIEITDLPYKEMLLQAEELRRSLALQTVMFKSYERGYINIVNGDQKK